MKVKASVAYSVLKLQILSLKNIKEHKDPSFVFFETVALFF